ncbi:MAG: methylenetetrahydrofolate reductase [NAD(P)H] [Deltaproteobacteria bacterium]|nr:methylenetetrahydrofolate reductase [NAD(P)H] [Deltaproteobacteria bacterium]
MRIKDFFQPGRTVFSIEVFPPKTPQGVENLKEKLKVFAAHQPHFISVTYGAAGGTRHTTGEISAHIKQNLGVEVLAHLTCVAHTQEEISQVLADHLAQGVENIMALRGDPPPGQTYTPTPGGYPYAANLVRVLAAQGRFGIAVAGYPEGHVEAPDYATDQQRLKAKVEAGADFIISQYFLDNRFFLRWRDDLRAMGITVPISAGVMPAQSLEQISRFSSFCGTTIPQALQDGLARFAGDPEGSARFGIEYAHKQVEGLLKEGVDGVHLYALNKLEPVESIAPLLTQHE